MQNLTDGSVPYNVVEFPDEFPLPILQNDIHDIVDMVAFTFDVTHLLSGQWYAIIENINRLPLDVYVLNTSINGVRIPLLFNIYNCLAIM